MCVIGNGSRRITSLHISTNRTLFVILPYFSFLDLISLLEKNKVRPMFSTKFPSSVNEVFMN